jgi:hypothetical protein
MLPDIARHCPNIIRERKKPMCGRGVGDNRLLTANTTPVTFGRHLAATNKGQGHAVQLLALALQEFAWRCAFVSERELVRAAARACFAGGSFMMVSCARACACACVRVRVCVCLRESMADGCRKEGLAMKPQSAVHVHPAQSDPSAPCSTCSDSSFPCTPQKRSTWIIPPRDVPLGVATGG